MVRQIERVIVSDMVRVVPFRMCAARARIRYGRIRFRALIRVAVDAWRRMVASTPYRLTEVHVSTLVSAAIGILAHSFLEASGGVLRLPQGELKLCSDPLSAQHH